MKTVHFAVVKWSKDGKKNCPGCDYYSLTCFVKLRPKDFMLIVSNHLAY